MTNYPEKIEGQPCSNNCGGKYVKNPKTGKVFCENKCWLNEPKSPKQASQETYDDKTEKRDKQISENIAWMNAKNNACLLIANGKGIDPTKKLLDNIINLAKAIYVLEAPNGDNEPF